jgi:hypothetical protein
MQEHPSTEVEPDVEDIHSGEPLAAGHEELKMLLEGMGWTWATGETVFTLCDKYGEERIRECIAEAKRQGTGGAFVRAALNEEWEFGGGARSIGKCPECGAFGFGKGQTQSYLNMAGRLGYKCPGKCGHVGKTDWCYPTDPAMTKLVPWTPRPKAGVELISVRRGGEPTAITAELEKAVRRINGATHGFSISEAKNHAVEQGRHELVPFLTAAEEVGVFDCGDENGMLQVWEWWESLSDAKKEMVRETVHQLVTGGDLVPTLKELVNTIQRRTRKALLTGTHNL